MDSSGVEGRALDPDKPSSAVEFKESLSSVVSSAVSSASRCCLRCSPLEPHAPRDANVPRACRPVYPQLAKLHTQAAQHGPASPKPSSDPPLREMRFMSVGQSNLVELCTSAAPVAAALLSH